MSAPTPSAAPSPIPWITALSVGGAGLIVGAVTGGMFLSQYNSLKARCPANECAPSDQSTAQSVQSLGTVSTVAFVVGGVGVASGAVLWFLQRDSHPSPRSPEGAPAQGASAFSVGLTPGGVVARGSF